MPLKGKVLYIFRWYWRQQDNYCVVCGQYKPATTPQPLTPAPTTNVPKTK